MKFLQVFRLKNFCGSSLLTSFSVTNPKISFKLLNLLKSHNFSSFPCSNAILPSSNTSQNFNLLPYNPSLTPSCGMKVKGQLKLRCKDCYIERKDGQLYVNCPTFPRHKQMAMRKRLKSQWILTYAFQSKVRPY